MTITAWTFFGFVLAQVIGLGLIWVLSKAGVRFDMLNETIFTTVANSIIYGLALVIVIGGPWWLKKRGTTWLDLGLQRPIRWRDLLWALGGAGVYFVLTALVTSAAMALLPDANYSQAQDTGFAYLVKNWEFTLAFLSLVIVAPVAEEVIFRGFLLGKLLKYIPSWIAVGITALLFAVAHGQFNVALDTFALGVVLAVLRVKTNSLWPSIVLHMLKNGIAFYFLFVNPSFL